MTPADLTAALLAHPAMQQVPEPRRREMAEAVQTNVACVHIAGHIGVPETVVTTLRAAKKRLRGKAKKLAENARRRQQRAAQGKTPKLPWTPATKPCACGREGCVAERREGEDRRNWGRRQYRNRVCANWAASERAKAKAAQAEEIAAEAASSRFVPVVAKVEQEEAACALLAALRLAHPWRVGEPTRETLHLWAASHSGRREWGTADVARLRAPTLVRTAVASEAA